MILNQRLDTTPEIISHFHAFDFFIAPPRADIACAWKAIVFYSRINYSSVRPSLTAVMEPPMFGVMEPQTGE